MPWSAERFLELHRKIRNKLCTEVFGHIMAVVVFSLLVIFSVVDVLKHTRQKDLEPDLKKLLAAVLGMCHFGICATGILYLKYRGVVELNPLKCKIWIYLEIYNIAATTTFIVIATRHLLPRPFHEWFGTAFLLLVYWLPLIMCKTSQICRMLELIGLLNSLQENSLVSLKKRGFDKTVVQSSHQPLSACTGVITTSRLGTKERGISDSDHEVQPLASTFSVSKPLSASSPHIPYEWALIDSINTSFP